MLLVGLLCLKKLMDRSGRRQNQTSAMATSQLHSIKPLNDKIMVNGKAATGKEGRQRWIVLVAIYACILAFAITFQSIPPVLSLIMVDLGLSHAQGGLLMSFFALPGIVVSIPAGMLADRYGQKAIGITSLILMIGGTIIFASGSSMPIFALGRVISGIGAMTLTVIAPQLLAQWFADRQLGIAMGIFNTGMPLGTILSLNLLSILGESLGWRTTIWMSAVSPLLALVIFVLFYAPAPLRNQRRSLRPEGLFRSIMNIGTPVWLVGAAWMFFNAALISFLTFTPGLLISYGFSAFIAGSLTSRIFWPPLLLNPTAGYLTDKIGRKYAMITAGSIAWVILLISVPLAGSWTPVLILLIGVTLALTPAPIFALAAEVVSPDKLGLGYGIIFTCSNIGILVGPAAVGFIKDVTGYYQASYALMSAFALMVTLTMIILSRRHKKVSMSS